MGLCFGLFVYLFVVLLCVLCECVCFCVCVCHGSEHDLALNTPSAWCSAAICCFYCRYIVNSNTA